MAKISNLPALADPTGGETAVVLDGTTTKRARLVDLVGAAATGVATSGDPLAHAKRFGQVFNDAVLFDDAWGSAGIRVPAGKTGQSSYLLPAVPIDGAALAGATIRVTVLCDVTQPFTRAAGFQGVFFGQVAGGDLARLQLAHTPIASPGRVGFTIDVGVEAGDRTMKLFLQMGAAAATAGDEELRLVAIRWRVIAHPSRSVIDVNVARRLDDRLDAAALTAEIGAPRRTSVQVFNGARKITRDGVDVGFAMPIATPGNPTSGYNSLIQVFQELDPAQAGVTVEVEIVAQVSDTFTRNPARYISIANVDGSADDATIAELRFTRVGSRLFWTFLRTIRPNNRAIAATIQTTADASVTGPAESLEIVSCSLRYLASADPVRRNPAEINRAIYRRRLLGDAADMVVRGASRTEIVVKADGTGDYPTVETANAAITTATPLTPFAIRVLPGRHTGFSGLMATKDHVDIVGANPRTAILYYANPVDASAGVLAQSYVAYVNSRTEISGIRAIVERARYVFHPDSNNVTNKDSVTRFFNCIVEHRGNATAVNANPAAPNTQAVAIGAGVESGSSLIIEACELIGHWGGGLAAHNNVDSPHPAKLVCRNSRSVAHEPGHYASVQSLGSGQADVAIYENCVLPGARFFLNNSLWLTQREDYRPANRTEWRVYGFGNSPAAAYVLDPCLALRITSAASTAASLVEIVEGGSAVPAIWGQVLASRGGVGRPADIYGTVDVSGATAGMTLGARLGDCSAPPKAFQVRFQGATKTVTFNTDLRGASNGDVLAIINAALGAAGAADLWAVAKETERPLFLDEEFAPRNATTTAIRRRTVLAFDGGVSCVRPMAATDPARLFAGIAIEDILAGEAGRVKGGVRAVKAAGYLALEDASTDGIAGLGQALAFGDGLGIGATPGRLVKNASISLIDVVEPANVASGFSAVLSLRG